MEKDDRLGGLDGHSFEPLLASMQAALTALAVGMSRGSTGICDIAYAKYCEVFGVKVAQKQAIAFMLAEMATEIEAVRLRPKAAWQLDQGR